MGSFLIQKLSLVGHPKALVVGTFHARAGRGWQIPCATDSKQGWGKTDCKIAGCHLWTCIIHTNWSVALRDSMEMYSRWEIYTQRYHRRKSQSIIVFCVKMVKVMMKKFTDRTFQLNTEKYKNYSLIHLFLHRISLIYRIEYPWMIQPSNLLELALTSVTDLWLKQR